MAPYTQGFLKNLPTSYTGILNNAPKPNTNLAAVGASTNMSSTTPTTSNGLVGSPSSLNMGTTANYPKIETPTNLLPSKYAASPQPSLGGATATTGQAATMGAQSGTQIPTQAPTTPPTATPGNTPYDPNNPHPYYVGQVGSYNLNTDPGVMAATKAQTDFNNQYVNDQSARTLLPNISGSETNLMDIANAGYTAKMPQYQKNIDQAIALANASQAGKVSAMDATAPHWNGYVGLNPINNQPIGGGTGGNSLNNIATWGANIDYATTAAGKSKDMETNQGVARSQGTNLVQQLQNTPDYNTDPVNVWNSLKQFLQKNISNPKYATIEASLTNVMAAYSSVLGQDTMTSLIQGAQAPSLAAFLQNIDDLAQKKIDATKSVGLGNAPTNAPAYSSVQAPTTNTDSLGQGDQWQLSPDGKSYTRIK